MEPILNYIKNLGKIIKTENISIDNILISISKLLNVGVILADNKGEIIFEIAKNIGSLGMKVGNKIKLEEQLVSQLSTIYEKEINISFDNLYTTMINKNISKKIFGILLPLRVSMENIGILIIYKKDVQFDNNIDIFCEYIEVVLGIIMHNNNKTKSINEQKDILSVKSSISTLSYSELLAVVSIFNALKGESGILVTSKIADEMDITRSVIVNALKKFESASIIETRSLGMKGTYIKILNEHIINEIQKFKN